jgi:phosphomannomutase
LDFRRKAPSNFATEPILRIYAEAKSDADAKKLIRLGVKLTKQV